MADPIVLGAVLAGVAGAFIACTVFVYYRFIHKVGEVSESRQVEVNVWGNESRAPNWVDPAEYNGAHYSRGARTGRPASTSTRDRRSRPLSQNVSTAAAARAKPRPVSAQSASARRSHQQQQQQPQEQQPTVRVTMPTDMRMPRADFENVVQRFYAAMAPQADSAELSSIAASTYGGSAADRQDLDRQLQREFGRGLDEWFLEQSRNDPAQAAALTAPMRGAYAEIHVQAVDDGGADDVPDARVVGANARNADTMALRAELLVHGAEKHMPALLEAGILSMEDLRNADVEVLELLFPDASERRLMISIARGQA